jgi:hypothetical protein
MSTASIPPTEATAPESSAVSRLIGVIVSPKETFASIARRPTWLVPFLILCTLSFVVGGLIATKTDWRGFFERKLSENSRFEQMSQEQKDQAIETQARYAPKFAFVIGIVVVVVVLVLMEVVYLGAFNLFNGANLTFPVGWGITTHAFVPSIIGQVLAIIILLIKPKGDIDPEHFLASSVAAFLPDGAPRWLDSLGQSLELFWIWTLVLVAIGFSAANPKKIKPGTAFLVVFGIWGLWVCGKVAWAAI